MASHVIFDRRRLHAHRTRAARRFAPADFLLREMGERLCDRLSDIKRSFPLALELGAHDGLLAELLNGRGGIEWLVQSDLSYSLLTSPAPSPQPLVSKLAADEEYLPFADNSFDAVLSVGALHMVNDLPGTLIQINRALKADGLFLAMLPGGETLKELRQSLEQAELMATGGMSPRVAPFIDVRDAGSLLQRAGFALPVVDSELITVWYDDPLRLMYDLRDMGQTNALAASAKGFSRRAVMYGALDYYQKHFANNECRVAATVELVTFTGWKPHESQQQPSKRGSGQVGLKDVLR